MTPTGNRETTREQDSIELALRESQARLSGIIASTMDAIITVDEAQRITLFNKAAEMMFGYSADEILGQPLGRLLPERSREIHHQHIRRFGETGVTNRSMGRLGTLYGLRANGQEFPIEASISQLPTREGKLYTVILRDVSERIKVEEALRESEQYLRATFEQAAIGIAHLTPDGRFLRVNRKLCEIAGYSPEELLNRSFADITHPDDLETDRVLHERAAQGLLESYVCEKRYIRKDGQVVWVNLTASLVRDGAGHPRYLLKVVEDITQRKAAEAALQAKADEIRTMTQQLWQTAKLATMGELAASIAHELNNPLAIVSLRIESLLLATPPDSPAYAELQVVEREVERMAALVANLLQFSRSSERQVSSLVITDEINRTLELVQNYLTNRRVTVQREFAADLPLVQADRQQMRQLFLNLITNAADAMPGGGLLRIRAAVRPPRTGSERPRVITEVMDTGEGIAPENLRSVMEPFYTTKPEGKGTGLGLAICKRIVEEHHGSIQVFSEGRGRGTTVQVILPSASGTASGFVVE